jgi:hypothetical protein
VFLVSAFSSYLSLRMREGSNTGRADILERVADVFFMVGLFALTAIMFLFAYEVI